MILQPFKYAYRELIANRVRQVPFWILVGFLPTFLLARFLVAHYPSIFLNIHGVHVHHFTYGFFILAIVGFASLVTPRHAQQWLAVAYGVGLSLAFDEFGMWTQLTANYNLDQSEDVMVAILVFLVIVVYFLGILRRALPRMRE